MPDDRVNNQAPEQDTSSCLLIALGFCASFISNQPSVQTPPETRNAIRQTNLGLATVGMSAGVVAATTTGPVNGFMMCAIPNLIARTNTAATQLNHPPRNSSEALAPCCTNPGSLINTLTFFAPILSAPDPAYILSGMANFSLVRSAALGE